MHNQPTNTVELHAGSLVCHPRLLMLGRTHKPMLIRLCGCMYVVEYACLLMDYACMYSHLIGDDGCVRFSSHEPTLICGRLGKSVARGAKKVGLTFLARGRWRP